MARIMIFRHSPRDQGRGLPYAWSTVTPLLAGCIEFADISQEMTNGMKADKETYNVLRA